MVWQFKSPIYCDFNSKRGIFLYSFKNSYGSSAVNNRDSGSLSQNFNSYFRFRRHQLLRSSESTIMLRFGSILRSDKYVAW